jgi:hypothetical protein
MTVYKEQTDLSGKVIAVFNMDTFASTPLDPANTDYQAYLKWLDEGNTPLPADDQTGQNAGNP